MDFFEKQAAAQKNTKWLLVYFVLAVVGIIASLQIVFTLLLGESPLNLETLGYVSGGVIVVVVLGSLIKIAELSQGGRVVASMLGGEAVSPTTTDFNERKLLNIVEEMSIASGVPVPEVYILPDETINAFAAGHGPGDTAIGVTRGCAELLTRDELQGVIAHEFSHILHGDMKLNIRLMGLLNGILGLALIGGIMVRYAGFGGSSSRRDSNSGGTVAFLILGGLALYAIGGIGVFFGKLIKAAVSRQREFLADSSAVQYTRNPDGIAAALWKIGKYYSRLSSPRAAEASHLFFGNGMGEAWLSMLATHPPIEDRIKAISPNFDPSGVRVPEPGQEVEAPARASATPPPLPQQPREIASDAFASALGFASSAAMSHAGAAKSALPDFAVNAVRNLHGACALMFALLLDQDADARAVQLKVLEGDPAMRDEVLSYFARRDQISGEQKIILLDLAIGTLRHLSNQQYATFREIVRHLIESDDKLSLLEFVLQKSLLRHLDLYFSNSTGQKIRYNSLAQLLPQVGVILSGLSNVGHQTSAEADAAYAAGVAALGQTAFSFRRDDVLDFSRIDIALDRLAESSPDVKRTVLDACRATVLHDGKIPAAERALLRAIADTFDCPMPLLEA